MEAPIIMQQGNEEMRNGWPLGLGNINPRIRDQAAALIIETPPRLPPLSILHRSTSFSSFLSSSNLDTESTASFYLDRSVSLGRLIGMWPPDSCKGKPHCEDEVNVAAADERSRHLHDPQLPKGQTHSSHGICVRLLHHVFGWPPATPKTSSL